MQNLGLKLRSKTVDKGEKDTSETEPCKENAFRRCLYCGKIIALGIFQTNWSSKWRPKSFNNLDLCHICKSFQDFWKEIR